MHASNRSSADIMCATPGKTYECQLVCAVEVPSRGGDDSRLSFPPSCTQHEKRLATACILIAHLVVKSSTPVLS